MNNKIAKKNLILNFDSLELQTSFWQQDTLASCKSFFMYFVYAEHEPFGMQPLEMITTLITF